MEVPGRDPDLSGQDPDRAGLDSDLGDSDPEMCRAREKGVFGGVQTTNPDTGISPPHSMSNEARPEPLAVTVKSAPATPPS